MTGPATQTVALGRIVKDPTFQVRAKKLDASWVARLTDSLKAGQALPAIRIADVGGTPYLVDGFHRAEALERVGRTHAEAEVSPMTRQQAQWAAASANLAHGKPLTSKELRAVFRVYVSARMHIEGRSKLRTYEAIAIDIGKAPSTIFRWMQADFPKIAQRMGGRDPSDASGGVRPEKPQTTRRAEAAIKALREAFQSTADAELRAELLTLARAAVQDMEEAADWRFDPGHGDKDTDF